MEPRQSGQSGKTPQLYDITETEGAYSGACTIVGIIGREKTKAEERLRACGVLGEEDLNEDRTIPVCSEEMYEVIADFSRGLESDRTARVSTKYKTVDRKVRPVAHPYRRTARRGSKGLHRTPAYEIRPA